MALRQISGSVAFAGQPLYSAATTRHIEKLAATNLPPHTLMQRAGLSLARLTLALAPHARCIWVACGPGNNGGDGFEAALQLHLAGKNVVVTWTGMPEGKTQPADAAASLQRAMQAGLVLSDSPPKKHDFCIDALLGLGASMDLQRAGMAEIIDCLRVMQTSGVPRLCVDLPSGLNADTGQSPLQNFLDERESDSTKSPLNAIGNAPESIANYVHRTSASAVFTLSFLVLKPGLFTAMGRDCAGEVWLDDLDVTDISVLANLNEVQPLSHFETSADHRPQVEQSPALPAAWLLGSGSLGHRYRRTATHASHKGSFGDVAVVGGESSSTTHMAGAALLAARGALHAGAGRIFVALLAESAATELAVDVHQPELMFRRIDALDLKQQVVVCGCGGGQAVKAVLAPLLLQAHRLVLDADALNAISEDSALQSLLTARQDRDFATVLTPHPLEAARLLARSAAQVQADRLGAAQQLVGLYGCTVVLKGSGTIVASPGRTSAINSSGNALLATAGTGDVLAGMLGAYLAGGQGSFEAACQAVFKHGHLADDWARHRPGEPLTASRLAQFQR